MPAGAPRPAEARGQADARRRRNLDHLDRDVVAAESVDEASALARGPTARAMSFCTSGVAVAVRAITGAGRKRRQVLAAASGNRGENRAPIARCNALHQWRPETACVWRASPGSRPPAAAPGAMKQELQRSVQIVDASLARGGAIPAGVNALHGKSALPQLGDLIFHKAISGLITSVVRRARSRELVAERFADPVGMTSSTSFPSTDGPANGFLVWRGRRRSRRPLQQNVGSGSSRCWRRLERRTAVLRGSGWPRFRSARPVTFQPLPTTSRTYCSIPFNKGVELRLPAVDAREVRLPLAGHRGAFHLGMHDLDQPDALVGRFEALAARARCTRA